MHKNGLMLNFLPSVSPNLKQGVHFRMGGHRHPTLTLQHNCVNVLIFQYTLYN